MRIDGGAGVAESFGLDVQTVTAVDQAALTVIQCPGNNEGLRIAAGKNALVTVVEAVRRDLQRAVTDQRPGVAVTQRASEVYQHVTVTAR